MSKGTRTSGYISLFLFFGGLALAGSGWKVQGMVTKQTGLQ